MKRKNTIGCILGWMFVISIFFFVENISSMFNYVIRFRLNGIGNMAGVVLYYYGFEVRSMFGEMIVSIAILMTEVILFALYGIGISGIIQGNKRKVKISAGLILAYVVMEYIVELVLHGIAMQISSALEVVLMLSIIVFSRHIENEATDVIIQGISSNGTAVEEVQNPAENGETDAMNRYERLLAMGAITHDEYELKKTEIMKQSK